jgi:ATP-dependent helicase HrpA
VEFYLRALPKELRRTFVPLAENAARMAETVASRHRLTDGRETVAEALAAEIRERHRLGVNASIWSGKLPPDHLQVRVRVRNEAGAELVASRDWAEIAAVVEASAGIDRAMKDASNAQHAARGLEAELRYEFAWLERDLKKIREFGPLAATLAPAEALQADALQLFKKWMLERERSDAPGSPATVKAEAERIKGELRKEMPLFLALLREILDLRSELLVFKEGYPGLEKDVNELVAPHFLATTPLEQLRHFPRYLKAMKLRSERWRKNPAKDAERMKSLAPYAKAPGAVRWLVEEFRVSLFAQELGTSEPVSAVKLDQAIAALRTKAGTPAPAKPAKPPVAVVRLDAPETKSKPLKSLTALDNLFTR